MGFYEAGLVQKGPLSGVPHPHTPHPKSSLATGLAYIAQYFIYYTGADITLLHPLAIAKSTL